MPRNQLSTYVIETAVEGGINYWAQVESYEWQDPTARKTDTRFSATAKIIEIGDGDEHIPHTITNKTINNAFKSLRAGDVEGLCSEIRARLIGQSYLAADDTDFDAIDADILVQIGLFGKVIYG